MNFEASSQRSRWLFRPEQLAEVRKNKRSQSLEAIKKAAADGKNIQQDSAADKGKLHAVRVDEAAKLLKYYAGKIQEAGPLLRLPRKVVGAATIFLQRLYLHISIMDRDPADLFVCCLYLAGKVEEHYMSAETLGKTFQQEESDLLVNEGIVLEALQFDLITYPPYRAIDGFFQELGQAQEAGGGQALVPATPPQLARAQEHAAAAADALLLTDAPLLFPPAQLGLAAMRSGLRQVGLSFTPYLEHAAQRLRSDAAEGGSQEALKYLRAQLEAIDAYGAEGAAKIDPKELKRIDRKLKQCRNWAVDPKGEAYRAAEAHKQQQLAQSRAQKLAERKRTTEQKEAEALGWDQPGPEPPSKRLRQQG